MGLWGELSEGFKEFTSQLREDTEVVREAAKQEVEKVRGAAEAADLAKARQALASKASGLGQHLEPARLLELGAVVFKDLEGAITQADVAVGALLEQTAARVAGGGAGGGAEGGRADNSEAARARHRERERAIATNHANWTRPVADAAGFSAFCDGFELLAHTERIEALLREQPPLRATHQALVPAVLSYRVFWERYFYEVELLQRQVLLRLRGPGAPPLVPSLRPPALLPCNAPPLHRSCNAPPLLSPRRPRRAPAPRRQEKKRQALLRPPSKAQPAPQLSCPGHVQDTSGTCPQAQPAPQLSCPGHVQDTSGTCPQAQPAPQLSSWGEDDPFASWCGARRMQPTLSWDDHIACTSRPLALHTCLCASSHLPLRLFTPAAAPLHTCLCASSQLPLCLQGPTSPHRAQSSPPSCPHRCRRRLRPPNLLRRPSLSLSLSRPRPRPWRGASGQGSTR